MPYKSFLKGASFIFLILYSSCASTKLESVWKDGSFKGGSFKNFMVIGVTDNLENRKMFEHEFVKILKSRGIMAVACGDVISTDKKLDRETIRKEVRKLKIDAVFVTRLIGTKEETVHSPPGTKSVLRGGGRYQVDYEFPIFFDYIHDPGASSKFRYVNLESKLYETETEKLIWSAKSETFDPETVKDVVKSLSKEVMKDLRGNKLIR